MTTTTSGTAEAYATALDHLARVSRRPDADEPRPAALSARDQALRAAATARRAMEAEHGVAATAAVEADADLRNAQAALTAARAADAAGVRVFELPGLVERERIAAVRAEATSRTARAAAEAMAARMALEDDHAAELADVNARLDEKGRRLSTVATRAETALSLLYQEAASYSAVVAEARGRLAELGFDDGGRFDGTPHPTRVGESLHVAGRRWPVVEPVEAVARSARRVALAAGARGRSLAEALRPRAGRERAAEPVLVNMPLPRLEAGRADA